MRANLMGAPGPQPIITTPNDFIQDLQLDLANGRIYWLQGHSGQGNCGCQPMPPRVMRANLDGSNIQQISSSFSFVAPELVLDPTSGRMYRGRHLGFGDGIVRANMHDGSDEFCVDYIGGHTAIFGMALLMNEPKQVLGDITGDNVVNVSDLLAVIAAWGPCGDPKDCPADIAPPPTGDGQVNVSDLLMVVANWG